jgi:hypothetical protein
MLIIFSVNRYCTAGAGIILPLPFINRTGRPYWRYFVNRFRDERLLVRTAVMLCLALLITTFPAVSSPQGTGEHTITNYEILEKIAGETLDELAVNMPSIARETIVLIRKEGGIGSGIDKVFENELVRKMTGAGLRIASKSADLDQTETSEYIFSYQIITYYVKYPDIGRSYWVGAKEVDRLAEVGIFAKLIDSSSGEIVWVGEAQKKYEDRIAYTLLDRVEDPDRDFTVPVRDEIKWSRFVEPVVVTGIVVGLVYLFFSNQDSN